MSKKNPYTFRIWTKMILIRMPGSLTWLTSSGGSRHKAPTAMVLTPSATTLRRSYSLFEDFRAKMEIWLTYPSPFGWRTDGLSFHCASSSLWWEPSLRGSRDQSPSHSVCKPGTRICEHLQILNAKRFIVRTLIYCP